MSKLKVTDKDREAARMTWPCGEEAPAHILEAQARAIATACAEEREAIAILADNYALYGRNGIRIAQAIRARGAATHSAADAASED